MILKPRGSHIGPAAGGAGVRTVIGVDPLVKSEVDILSEALEAELAHKRLLALVEADMGLEVGEGGEALIAAFEAAQVGLLAAVDQQVLLEVGELAEGLGALLALEWLLPTVYSHVNLQVGHLLEGFVALHAGQSQVALPEHGFYLLLCGGKLQLRLSVLVDGRHDLAEHVRLPRLNLKSLKRLELYLCRK